MFTIRLVVSRNSKDGVPFRMCELFSGIGAQRMGARRSKVPVEVVGISEIDEAALASYEAIWGDCPNLGDITKVEHLPSCDILTYSFPCQSLSKAGNGNVNQKHGMKKGSGTESSLLWEVGRLLEDAESRGTLPEWLIMENVTDVHSKRYAKDFDKWISFLEGLGYTSRYGDLNARDWGPQSRKRCFMISHLGGGARTCP